MKKFASAMMLAYVMGTSCAHRPTNAQILQYTADTPQIGLQYRHPHWQTYEITSPINLHVLGKVASHVGSRLVLGNESSIAIGPQESLYGFDVDGDYKIETRLYMVGGIAKILQIDLTSPRGEKIFHKLHKHLKPAPVPDRPIFKGDVA